MAKKDKAAKAAKEPGKIALMRQNYQMSKQLDPAITWWMLGSLLVVGGIVFSISFFTGGPWWLATPLALISGVLAALIIMGRRSQKAAIASIEGQPGAAVRVLSMLRRGWKVDELVGFNKQQDMVHRVVGRPGIVLVGEGNPTRVRQLLATERRKHERVLYEVVVYEIVVGNGEDQVPLDKLVKTVTKLPKSLKGAAMTDVLSRLRALDANRSRIPIPKGPVPTSMKGQRGAMRGR
ncbi:DUF4191 domain-containing protein [Alteromonas gracilis]